MIRSTLITAVAAIALAVAPAAWGQGPDAFERAVNAKLRTNNVSVYPDAVERAAAADMRPSNVSTYRDAFERALHNRISASPRTIPGDHHDRVALPEPSPVSVPTSGDGIEWPQVGIGFGFGALLALGLMLTLRAVRTRQLAH